MNKYFILFLYVCLFVSCEPKYKYAADTLEGKIERKYKSLNSKSEYEILSIERIDSVIKVEANDTIGFFIKEIKLLLDRVDDQSAVDALVPNVSNALYSWNNLLDWYRKDEVKTYKLTFSTNRVTHAQVHYSTEIFFDESHEEKEWTYYKKKYTAQFLALRDTLEKLCLMDKTTLRKKADVEIKRKEAEKQRLEKEAKIKAEKEREEALKRLKNNPEYQRGYNYGNRDGRGDRDCGNEKYTSYDYNGIVKQGQVIHDRNAYCSGYEVGYEDGYARKYRIDL